MFGVNVSTVCTFQLCKFHTTAHNSARACSRAHTPKSFWHDAGCRVRTTEARQRTNTKRTAARASRELIYSSPAPPSQPAALFTMVGWAGILHAAVRLHSYMYTTRCTSEMGQKPNANAGKTYKAVYHGHAIHKISRPTGRVRRSDETPNTRRETEPHGAATLCIRTYLLRH